MNITPDYLIERKRNKQQLMKWKIFALILIVLGLFMYGKNSSTTSDNISQVIPSSGDYIASIRIDDAIFQNLKRDRKLREIAKDDKIKAVIVHINSQGGSVVGSERLYNSLLKISKVKPVVVVMESVAASGGYLASLGGDYIIAYNGTITGSIGVIMQSFEMTKLAEMVGVTFNNFKSAPLKASPNPTEELTQEAKQATMDSIYEVYDYFISIVASRRNLDIEYVRKLADGRIYSGRQALELKLIDAIGDEDTALKWLHDKKDISKDLQIIDISLNRKDSFLDVLLEDLQNSIFTFFSSSSKGIQSII